MQFQYAADKDAAGIIHYYNYTRARKKRKGRFLEKTPGAASLSSG
jgi:hypothetical protein